VVEIFPALGGGDRRSCCGLLHYEGAVADAAREQGGEEDFLDARDGFKLEGAAGLFSCQSCTILEIGFSWEEHQVGKGEKRHTINASRALSSIVFITNLFSSLSNIPKLFPKHSSPSTSAVK